MISARTFDEVNNLIKNKRGIDFEEYFGDMELTEEEREERIALAEKFQDEFLIVIAMLFTMQQYGMTDYENVRAEFVLRYKEALDGFVDIDSYMDTYITSLSYDIMDATANNPDDPYYFSPDRAKVLAENESNTSLNHRDYVDAVNSGKTRKKWLTMKDKRVRHTHRAVDEKIIGINELFLVGDSLMAFPKDETYAPSSSEVVNCRCVTKYLK